MYMHLVPGSRVVGCVSAPRTLLVLFSASAFALSCTMCFLFEASMQKPTQSLIVLTTCNSKYTQAFVEFNSSTLVI